MIKYHIKKETKKERKKEKKEGRKILYTHTGKLCPKLADGNPYRHLVILYHVMLSSLVTLLSFCINEISLDSGKNLTMSNQEWENGFHTLIEKRSWIQ